MILLVEMTVTARSARLQLTFFNVSDSFENKKHVIVATDTDTVMMQKRGRLKLMSQVFSQHLYHLMVHVEDVEIVLAFPVRAGWPTNSGTMKRKHEI